jgi:hypothetical protein
MRCDEIRERFVELLYKERGTPAASPELKAHIESCPGCRKELEDLKSLQGTLRVWKDETPLRPVRIPEAVKSPAIRRFSFFNVVRYAGIAALVTLAFLALSNAEFTWNHDGFSFKTHAFSRQSPQSGYPTNAEVRRVLKDALRESESYMMEYNSQQLNAALDLIERQMGQEMQFVRSHYSQAKGKN